MSRRPGPRRKSGKRDRPPEGEVRRSQVVGTYGPGAMIDLVHHAVVVGGLDFWSYPNAAATVIDEPRLREKLVERLRGLDPPLNLSESAPFQLPPAGDSQSPLQTNGIQALEMPSWFVCQNTDCRALVRSGTLNGKNGRYTHRCADDSTSEMVPVRFVGACRNGHLQDFPWIEFVHPGGRCPSPRLRLDEGASGDFFEIRVSCTSCGESAPLKRARIEERRLPCRGERPWLGEEGRERCDQPLKLLVRTASNGYFAQVVSALSIPDPTRGLEERVGKVWDVLKDATPQTLSAFRTIEKVRDALIEDGAPHPDEAVMAVVEARRSGRAAPRPPLRTAEIERFREAPFEQRGELPHAADANFFARRIEPPPGLGPEIRRLVIAPRLREVRVQVGFTRLEPTTADLQGEFDLGVRSQRLGLLTNWLPASEIRGEGIFLELAEDAVRAWEGRPEVHRRDEELRAGFEAWADGHRSARELPYPGVRFYLLHSLSHLLITSISLACGYPSASIRERLYSAQPGDDGTESGGAMAALLLSTGSAGAEGTLGGLVEEGRRLDHHLARALEMARLCSNDPVCAFHSPRSDYAERYLEGAACHGCLFIAEPSCERFNRFLDRALVVPTLGRDPGLAFFGEG